MTDREWFREKLKEVINSCKATEKKAKGALNELNMREEDEQQFGLDFDVEIDPRDKKTLL